MAEQQRQQSSQVSDRSVGELVAEVSDKTTLLVRQEIELAKAELRTNISRIVAGAVVATVAGVFAVLAIIYLLHAVALFFFDVVGFPVWVGYLVVTGGLVILGAVCAWIAFRAVKGGSPAPKQAIEEARKTREMLSERPQQ